MVARLSSCLAPLGLHCALHFWASTVRGLEPMNMLSGPWAPPAEMPSHTRAVASRRVLGRLLHSSDRAREGQHPSAQLAPKPHWISQRTRPRQQGRHGPGRHGYGHEPDGTLGCVQLQAALLDLKTQRLEGPGPGPLGTLTCGEPSGLLLPAALPPAPWVLATCFSAEARTLGLVAQGWVCFSAEEGAHCQPSRNSHPRTSQGLRQRAQKSVTRPTQVSLEVSYQKALTRCRCLSSGLNAWDSSGAMASLTLTLPAHS